MVISKTRAQRRLAILWFSMAALPTALLIFNTQKGLFDLHEKARTVRYAADIWKWYSPFLFPTLLLMLGTLRTAEEAPATPAESSVFYFRLCCWLSVFYGISLTGSICIELNKLAGEEQTLAELVENLKQDSVFLTVMQSLLNLALGLFFTEPAARPVAAAPESSKTT